jgi:hypothetical protein
MREKEERSTSRIRGFAEISEALCCASSRETHANVPFREKCVRFRCFHLSRRSQLLHFSLGIGEIGRVLERVSFSLRLPRLRVPDDGDLNTTSTLFFSLRTHLRKFYTFTHRPSSFSFLPLLLSGCSRPSPSCRRSLMPTWPSKFNTC